ncbi:hypothetical protein Salat_0936800 [Sesamum alatum]|uniref:BED-type domain-containing protein n=1 Tax=Sesamum alatum TaxID=300844 RepID=A0AAE2CRF7_9LAMI|nr:hypothetical protein Salat_0936800 [Sesamum alatum]
MTQKLDNGWEHATPVGGGRKKCKRNYCEKVVHGRITRLKQHIAHVSENVETCSRVPSEIGENSLYGEEPNIYTNSIDGDDDDIDEHVMLALEQKQLKQAVAENRYMKHVEDETRRTPSRGASINIWEKKFGRVSDSNYNIDADGATAAAMNGRAAQRWGIMDPNMTLQSLCEVRGVVTDTRS